MIGLGMGLIFSSAISTGTSGVQREDAGVASATVNTTQQVGGSIGTALLSTIDAGSVRRYAAADAGAQDVQAYAVLHGYHVASPSPAPCCWPSPSPARSSSGAAHAAAPPRPTTTRSPSRPTDLPTPGTPAGRKR